MKVLRITLDGEEHPNYCPTNAFKQEFGDVDTIWWENAPLPSEIRQKLSNAYDFCFMQIQRDGVISESLMKEISDKMLVFNWTGDVREDLTPYMSVGNHAVTLFTNETDVEKMRKAGYKADYLQIGYDDIKYKAVPSDRFGTCFFGNLYPSMSFPLTQLRIDMCNRLISEFSSFKLYGGGWNGVIDGITPSYEAEVYNQTLIGINLSQFNYKRYTSDRMFRMLGCGLIVLSHRFDDCEKDFKDGGNVIFWDDLDDLVEKIRDIEDSLVKADGRYVDGRFRCYSEIAKNGMEYAQKQCTWSNRMKDLKNLYHKYK